MRILVLCVLFLSSQFVCAKKGEMGFPENYKGSSVAIIYNPMNMYRLANNDEIDTKKLLGPIPTNHGVVEAALARGIATQLFLKEARVLGEPNINYRSYIDREYWDSINPPAVIKTKNNREADKLNFILKNKKILEPIIEKYSNLYQSAGINHEDHKPMIWKNLYINKKNIIKKGKEAKNKIKRKFIKNAIQCYFSNDYAEMWCQVHITSSQLIFTKSDTLYKPLRYTRSVAAMHYLKEGEHLPYEQRMEKNLERWLADDAVLAINTLKKLHEVNLNVLKNYILNFQDSLHTKEMQAYPKVLVSIGDNSEAVRLSAESKREKIKKKHLALLKAQRKERKLDSVVEKDISKKIVKLMKKINKMTSDERCEYLIKKYFNSNFYSNRLEKNGDSSLFVSKNREAYYSLSQDSVNEYVFGMSDDFSEKLKYNSEIQCGNIKLTVSPIL